MENQAVPMIKARTNRAVVFIQTDFHMQLAKVENAVMTKLTILTTWSAVEEMNSCLLVPARKHQEVRLRK